MGHQSAEATREEAPMNAYEVGYLFGTIFAVGLLVGGVIYVIRRLRRRS